MIERYSVPELTKIWSDENKFQTWLRVEIAVVQAWGNAGVIPQNDVQLITNNAKIHVPDIMQYIDETHHDVTAFLRSISDSLRGPAKPTLFCRQKKTNRCQGARSSLHAQFITSCFCTPVLNYRTVSENQVLFIPLLLITGKLLTSIKR